MKENASNIADELESMAKALKSGCGSTMCLIHKAEYWVRDSHHDTCRCSPREVAARLQNLSEKASGYTMNWGNK